MGWRVFSHFHSYAESLPSRTSECDCIWRLGLYRGDSAKMGFSEWALIRYDQYSYWKGKWGHRHRVKTTWQHRGKTAILVLKSKALQETNPADTLSWTYGAPELWENNLWNLSCLTVVLCHGSHSKLIHRWGVLLVPSLLRVYFLKLWTGVDFCQRFFLLLLK